MSDEIRLLRRAEVERRAGVAGRHLDQLEDRGLFPKRVPLASRTVAWVEAEVQAWCVRRITERNDQLPRRREAAQSPR